MSEEVFVNEGEVTPIVVAPVVKEQETKVGIKLTTDEKKQLRKAALVSGSGNISDFLSVALVAYINDPAFVAHVAQLSAVYDQTPDKYIVKRTFDITADFSTMTPEQLAKAKALAQKKNDKIKSAIEKMQKTLDANLSKISSIVID